MEKVNEESFRSGPRLRSLVYTSGNESDSTESKRAAVNVVSVSKAGFIANNFIVTHNSAYQQDSAGRNPNLDQDSNLKLDLVPLNVMYLNRIRREKEERNKRNTSKRLVWQNIETKLSKLRHSSARPEVSIAGSDPVDSTLKNVLQSLVNLLRPSECVRFLSPLKKSKVNETYFEPSRLGTSDLSQPASDLFVAIVSNGKDGVETSIVLLLKQKETKELKELIRKKRDRKFKTLGNAGQNKNRLTAGSRSRSEVFSGEESVYSNNDSVAVSDINKLKRASAGRKSNRRGTRNVEVIHGKNEVPGRYELEIMSLIHVLSDTRIRLNGGGQLKIVANNVAMQIDTVSIRSMWSFVTALQRARHFARNHNFYSVEMGHSWTDFYITEMNKNLSTLTRNFRIENAATSPRSRMKRKRSVIVESELSEESDGEENYFGDNENLPSKKELKNAIKHIISQFDPDEITSMDVYQGLQVKYGDHIVGETGYSKSLVDKYTITAVGQLDPPSKIFEGLYLGTEYNASNRREMTSLGIKLVVNVTEEVENFFPNYLEYHSILLQDRPHCNLKEHFRAAIDRMHQAIEEGEGILVHCQRGISRSATIVIAYLMKYRGMSRDEAYKFVKKQRPIVRPNDGFLQQLEDFEAELA
eukprot:snap_masked-scaffold_1-processed-gene-3.15-mRNA-1 protein AED:0.38 eAED:0.38 QI:0/-1/0/1/-1/1/1/0/640